MKCLRELPSSSEKQAEAIGVFDGIHRGHRVILQRALDEADRRGLPSAVLTFEPDPHQVLEGASPTQRRLLTREDKMNILSQLGFDRCYEVEFTREFAATPPDEFLDDVLLRRLNVRVVVVGEDFRFGHRREGDTSLLRSRLESHGVRVHVESSLELDGRAVGSTRIRQHLRNGEVRDARLLLGRPYAVHEAIQTGEGRGQKIGFPTFNFPLTRTIHPRQGVYMVWLGTRERAPAVANFGRHPTVGAAEEPLLEVHALDDPPPFEAGDTTHVYFEAFVRPETAFESIEELKEQIRRDVDEAREAFREVDPPAALPTGLVHPSLSGS